MKRRKSEGGQVLVLIVLAIVGLFGFAALAVDGGRVFAERRRAQNAADAAAMAAAYAGAVWNDWSAAGIVSTTTNGYNDTDPDENAGAVEDVRVHHPPAEGKYSVASETINPNEYYQVIIRMQVPQVFSQIVYSGPLWIEVEAVSRGTPQVGFPAGSALVTTCKGSTCCPGNASSMSFGGSGVVKITGGNAISSSTNTKDPNNPGCHSVELSGGAYMTMVGGKLIAGGSLYNHGETTDAGTVDLDAMVCKDEDKNIIDCINGPVTLFTPNSDTYYYPYQPSCEGLPIITEDKYNSDDTLNPGVYTNGITVGGNSTITLTPGMYCLDGDLSVGTGRIISQVDDNETATKDDDIGGVMFFMRDGDIIIQTDGVYLSSPVGYCIDDPSAIVEECWSGFLFYMPYENDGTIQLSASGANYYHGTIYAPGPPLKVNVDYKCTLIGGQDASAIDASIICYTVNVLGDGGLTIVYDDKLHPQTPGALELAQ